MLGTNGGGFFNVNSAMPFENPTGLSNFLEMLFILVIPAGARRRVRPHGREPPPGVGDLRAMAPVPRLRRRGLRRRAERVAGAEGRGESVARRQPRGQGGPLRARRAARCGPRSRPSRRTARSTAAHDSLTGIGGLVPLVNMMTGEVDLRRRRLGALRDAPDRAAGGLHRRADGGAHARIPGQEDRGARGQAGPDRHAGRAAARSWSPPRSRSPRNTAATSIFNPGPQGFSETLYAYTSQTNNNGSAFAGYTGFVQPNAPGNAGRVRNHVRGPAGRRRDARRPLRAAAGGARRGRRARRQAHPSARPRHLPHRHADLRRPAHVRDRRSSPR